jgi:hypothetical protein
VWIEAGGGASLDTTDVRLRRGDVLLAREEERHVHRDAGEDRLLDGRDALGRAGDLDEEVRAAGAAVQVSRGGDGALRVVREIGRDLERYPAVDTVRRLVDRAEEIGGAGQVLERQLEEESLAGEPAAVFSRMAAS